LSHRAGRRLPLRPDTEHGALPRGYEIPAAELARSGRGTGRRPDPIRHSLHVTARFPLPLPASRFPLTEQLLHRLARCISNEQPMLAEKYLELLERHHGASRAVLTSERGRLTHV